MNTCFLFRVNASIFFVVLYVVLYYIVHKTGLNQTQFQSVSFFFLPAVVRLVAALVVGLWSIPVLFVGGAVCIFAGWYDLGPGIGQEFLINGLSALGGPLGTFWVLKCRAIRSDLAGLSVQDLIWLSAGCAAGNALFLRIGYSLLDMASAGQGLMLSIFIGDCVGVWVMMLILKALLPFFGRLIGPVMRVDMD